MKYKVTLNDKTYEIEVEDGKAMLLDEYKAKAPAAEVSIPAAPVTVPAAQKTVVSASGTNVTAPLPGNVMTLKVSEGQSVKAGDILVIIEAMKMENEVLAPCDGVVKQIVASKGSSVATGDVLLVI